MIFILCEIQPKQANKKNLKKYFFFHFYKMILMFQGINVIILFFIVFNTVKLFSNVFE